MDPSHIFRRLFGFPNKPPLSFSLDDRNQGQRIQIFFDDNSNELEEMFEHFHCDMRRQMDSLQSSMDDMIQGFGLIDFPSSFDQQPRITLVDPDKSGHHGNNLIWGNIPNPFFRSSGTNSLRDFMLKEGADDDLATSQPVFPKITDKPSWSAQPKINKFDSILQVPQQNSSSSQSKRDTDLDGKISEKKLLEMIQQPTMSTPQQAGSAKSVIVSTVRGPHNKMEHKRTVTDSAGNKESSVTRSMGDKSYTITTVTGQDGQQQQHEVFSNMDQNDLPKFKEDWLK